MKDRYFNDLLLVVKAATQPYSYGRTGQMFVRTLNDLFHAIQFQRSRDYLPKTLKVTVNIGIYSSAIARACKQPEKLKSVWESHWRTRLGCLMPHNNDKWWEIDTEEEFQTVSREIVDSIIIYALPELEKIQTTQQLIELWESGSSPGLTDMMRDNYLQEYREWRQRFVEI